MSGKRKDISKEISGLLLIVLILLMGLSLLKQFLPTIDGLMMVAVYLLIYFLPMVIYAKRHRYKLRHSLRLKGVHPKYLLFIFFFGLSVCLICSLINLGSNAFFKAVFHVSYQNSIVDLSGKSAGSLFFTSVLLPALAEELLLRGMVQSEYEKYGSTIGVLLTALIFALFHTNPMHIPALFVAGVCYGVLTLMFKSVWPAIFAHGINNGVSLLIAQKQDYIRYIFQDRLFIILAVVACFLLLIFTLRMLESAAAQTLGKGKVAKRSTKSLAYGDPLLSPWIWVFIALCIGKMVYNGFFG